MTLTEDTPAAEPGRASSDALTFLLAILDDLDTAVLTLPPGESVRPVSGFTAVATLNGNPAEDLPAPLRDRFPVALTIDQVHPAALATLPADLRIAAAGATFTEPERRVSVRVWGEFARPPASLGEEAARACFG